MIEKKREYLYYDATKKRNLCKFSSNYQKEILQSEENKKYELSTLELVIIRAKIIEKDNRTIAKDYDCSYKYIKNCSRDLRIKLEWFFGKVRYDDAPGKNLGDKIRYLFKEYKFKDNSANSIILHNYISSCGIAIQLKDQSFIKGQLKSHIKYVLKLLKKESEIPLRLIHDLIEMVHTCDRCGLNREVYRLVKPATDIVLENNFIPLPSNDIDFLIFQLKRAASEYLIKNKDPLIELTNKIDWEYINKIKNNVRGDTYDLRKIALICRLLAKIHDSSSANLLGKSSSILRDHAPLSWEHMMSDKCKSCIKIKENHSDARECLEKLRDDIERVKDTELKRELKRSITYLDLTIMCQGFLFNLNALKDKGNQKIIGDQIKKVNTAYQQDGKDLIPAARGLISYLEYAINPVPENIYKLKHAIEILGTTSEEGIILKEGEVKMLTHCSYDLPYLRKMQIQSTFSHDFIDNVTRFFTPNF